jgi:ubiquinone/menaquinone biosynthesis C-methylase UbiE
MIKATMSDLIAPFAPEQAKYLATMAFWHNRFALEKGRMRNGNLDFFCTEFFGLAKSDFEGLRLLDVGCGPRGSLEWADNAARRVGIDPLANRFGSLGTRAHAMAYAAAPAESIPFPDASFDFVFCFNALAHTANPAASMREMSRVLCPGGHLLIIAPINQAPTRMRPHRLGMGFFDAFAGALHTRERRLYPMWSQALYRNLREREPDVPFDTDMPSILAAHFVRS